MQHFKFKICFRDKIRKNSKIQSVDRPCVQKIWVQLNNNKNIENLHMQVYNVIQKPYFNSTFIFFLQDGRITNDEFKEAVQKTCVGKKYAEFPQVG